MCGRGARHFFALVTEAKKWRPPLPYADWSLSALLRQPNRLSMGGERRGAPWRALLGTAPVDILALCDSMRIWRVVA